MVRRWLMTTMMGGVVLLVAACDAALLTSLLGSTTPAGTPPGEIGTVSEFGFDGVEIDARGVAVYDGDPGFLQYAADRNGTAASALVLEKSGGTEDPDLFRYSLGAGAPAGVRTVAFWFGSADPANGASANLVLGAAADLDEAFSGDWRANPSFAESAHLEARVGRYDAESLFVSARAWGVQDVYTMYQGAIGADSSWFHVAVVLDASRVLRVYLNGRPVTRTDLAVANVRTTDDLALVIVGSGGPGALVDDLVLLETPLGPDDVAALHTGELDLP